MATRDPATGCVYLGGAFMAPTQARVSAFDHGFLYGDGLFETLRTYAGAPFRMAEHLRRLAEGLAVLEFPTVPELASLGELVLEALARARLPDAYVRITVTRGVSFDGLDPAHCHTPTVMVAALPLRAYPDAAYRDGVRATLLWPRSRHDRPPLGVKTTSYQRGVLARSAIRARGASEGFYLDEAGFVTEGSVSNVFARYGEHWVTPPASACLPGITRAEVLAIAAAGGLSMAEEELSVPRLLEADEVFVTSSLAELLPVVQVDGHRIGDGVPGLSQQRMRREYLERARRHV